MKTANISRQNRTVSMTLLPFAPSSGLNWTTTNQYWNNWDMEMFKKIQLILPKTIIFYWENCLLRLEYGDFTLSITHTHVCRIASPKTFRMYSQFALWLQWIMKYSFIHFFPKRNLHFSIYEKKTFMIKMSRYFELVKRLNFMLDFSMT